MVIKDFLELEISSRADLVWDEGEFLGSRDYYGYTVALYVLEGLYVEVWVFNATNKIEKVEPIQNDKDLQHYLKDIDIEKLLNQ
jgi:hypothetical protein